MTDLTSASIRQIQAALRTREISSRQLTEAAIQRRERFGARLNAYKTWNPEAALKQADEADAAFGRGEDLGLLQGIPVSVKDLYGAPGWPTFGGTAKRMPAAWEAAGPVVAALIAQRAVIMGKTHTVEFAYGGLGTNPHWGAPWNPWDARDHRAPGGSSAGAGVSLLEGSAFVALGTDTGGSVRVPASFTGTVGIKTTKGRWPTGGIVPLSQTLDTPGILTRTVEDAALAVAAIEAHLEKGPTHISFPRPVDTLRLAVTRDFFRECTPAIAQAFDTAIEALRKAGATVITIDFPESAEAAGAADIASLLAVEGYANVVIEFPDWLDTVDPNVKRRMDDSRAITAVEYLKALAHLRKLQAAAAVRLADVDAVLAPTTPISPPRLADVAEWESYRRVNAAALSHTSVGNRLGLCAISLPCGRDELGLPVGLMLMAAPGRDRELMEVALATEGVLGTAAQRVGEPPVTTG